MNKHAKAILIILTLGIVTIAVAVFVAIVATPRKVGAPSDPASIPATAVTASPVAPISLGNLAQNQPISLPYQVTGTAPGNWFFEASFPVKLLDANSNLVLQTHAQAIGNWMTAGSVAFAISLPANPYIGNATLVFSKDNPSGEPQNDASVSMPIVIQ